MPVNPIEGNYPNEIIHYGKQSDGILMCDELQVMIPQNLAERCQCCFDENEEIVMA
jgi:hypothetical protein